MGYKSSEIRALVDKEDLLGLVLNLKDIRDELMEALGKINAELKMLEPILKEKMERKQ